MLINYIIDMQITDKHLLHYLVQMSFSFLLSLDKLMGIELKFNLIIRL